MSTWPQWTLLGIMVFSTLICISKDGQKHSDYNAGYSIAGFVITIFLLWQGNFFHALGWQ